MNIEPPAAVGGRRTFIVQLHPDGATTLENALTRERVRIEELATIGAQIERWLAHPVRPMREARRE